MAGNPSIVNVWRDQVPSFDINGESVGTEDDNGLFVKIDRYAGASEHIVIRLPFADYAGLEAEWEAGSATTVLKAAVETALGALDLTAYTKTGPQLAAIGYEMTIE